MQQTPIPDIFQYNDINPRLISPNSEFEISFAQTKETLLDIDVYKRFITSAIGQFRHSRAYKHYKAHLMQMGLDRSQVRANIISNEENEMATIEMHHNILTIFDVALIISEHTLNTQGSITTFDLYSILKQEHLNHHVATVMLDKTAHQMVHANRDFIIPPSMCFGDWITFLQLYRSGITRDIAFKIIYYLDKCIKSGNELDSKTTNLLGLKQWITEWGNYNNDNLVITSDITD